MVSGSLQRTKVRISSNGLDFKAFPEIISLLYLRGESGELVNQLRDSYLEKDKDGKMYLLYAAGGEKAIGMSRIEIKK